MQTLKHICIYIADQKLHRIHLIKKIEDCYTSERIPTNNKFNLSVPENN